MWVQQLVNDHSDLVFLPDKAACEGFAQSVLMNTGLGPLLVQGHFLELAPLRYNRTCCCGSTAGPFEAQIPDPIRSLSNIPAAVPAHKRKTCQGWSSVKTGTAVEAAQGSEVGLPRSHHSACSHTGPSQFLINPSVSTQRGGPRSDITTCTTERWSGPWRSVALSSTWASSSQLGGGRWKGGAPRAPKHLSFVMTRAQGSPRGALRSQPSGTSAPARNHCRASHVAPGRGQPTDDAQTVR